MKVKCIEAYYDLKLKKSVNINDVFEVDETRAKELSTKDNKAGRALVVIVEEAVETTPTTVKKRGRGTAKKDV